MKVKDVVQFLESVAPVHLQEDYDNSGLLVGDMENELTGILVSLDCTEEIVQEAIDKKCNLIVSHHPIIFKGLKNLTGKNYVDRTVIKAIKNNISLYAIHTNLDNIQNGVNLKIMEKLGITTSEILSPKTQLLRKLVVFCPNEDVGKLKDALFNAGAGNIGNYSDCSFSIEGKGTFKPGEGANPHVGEMNSRHEAMENRVEVIYPFFKENEVLSAMRNNHPYEEVAHDIYTLQNQWQDVGSGAIGELKDPMNEEDFLIFVKSCFGLKMVRFTPFLGKKVKKIAVCGGSGSFLIKSALAQKADVFISSDIKYHEFFDAEGKMVIMDIGHYESEQFTIDLLGDLLKKKFTTFAVRLTELNTNPINYR